MLTGKGWGICVKIATQDSRPHKEKPQADTRMFLECRSTFDSSLGAHSAVTAPKSRKQGQHNSDEQRTWDMGLNQRLAQHVELDFSLF